MQPQRKFTIEEPRVMGSQLGVNQSIVDFAEFRRALQIELEHGSGIPEVTAGTPVTGKIAWAHLKGVPDTPTRRADSKPKRISSRQRKG